MMRYIIENGEGYQVEGKKAYKVSFDLDRKMIINDKEKIDVEGKKTYSYNELVKKLNVDYFNSKEKENLSKDDEVLKLEEEKEILIAKVEELQKQNEELNAKVEELSNQEQPKEPIEGETQEAGTTPLEGFEKLNVKEKK